MNGMYLLGGMLSLGLLIYLMVALLLVEQGAVQTLDGYRTARFAQPMSDETGQPSLDEEGRPRMESANAREQVLAVSPVAWQVAIKHLGTIRGGFFSANAAHPIESPTPFTDFLLILAETAIAAALTSAFGVMVGDRRQGWAILAAMLAALLVFVLGADLAESSGNPLIAALGFCSLPTANLNHQGARTFGMADLV